MDILDQEADEDELFRENQAASERLPSHEANKDLIEREQRYRAVIQQAKDSDELVRHKWEEWEDNITQLTWSEVSLSPIFRKVVFAFIEQSRVHRQNWRAPYRLRPYHLPRTAQTLLDPMFVPSVCFSRSLMTRSRAGMKLRPELIVWSHRTTSPHEFSRLRRQWSNG